MQKRAKKLAIIFFRTENGKEPVREWIQTFSNVKKRIIGEDIKTVQFGWPLGMPLVRHLESGLWEIRIKLRTRRIARMIFFMDKDVIVLVNGFIKKSQKMPKSELELAKCRKKAYQTVNIELSKV